MADEHLDLAAQSTINFANPQTIADARAALQMPRRRTVARKDIAEWLVAHSGGVVTSPQQVVALSIAAVFFVLTYLGWVVAHGTPGPLLLDASQMPKVPEVGKQRSIPLSPGAPSTNGAPPIPRPLSP